MTEIHHGIAEALSAKDATIDRQRDLIRELVFRLEESTAMMIADRNNFYDSVSLNDGEVPDEDDREWLSMAQERIDWNEEALARAKKELGE